MLNHYDVLDVDPTADLDTIRHAWRVKLRLLHPDAHHGSSAEVRAQAARETLRVNTAWETLRDTEKRHSYDLHLARVGRAGTREHARDVYRSASDDEDDIEIIDRRSNYLALDITSVVIVVVAASLVVVGLVLLAGLTQ